MRNSTRVLLYIALLAESVSTQWSGVVINELMAVNHSTFTDEYRQFDDWVELYNNSDNAIDINNFYLSDSKNNLTKSRLQSANPDQLVIQPDSFLVLWADDSPDQGALHASFKLDGAGEQLFLVASDGTTIIDSVAFGVQYSDISYGRFPDGAASWVYHQMPTPAGPNAPARRPTPAPPRFSLPAGFYADTVTLTLSSPDNLPIFFTTDGSNPFECDSLLYQKPITLSATTVISARTFSPLYDSGTIITQTYLIDEPTTIPIVSLVTDPPNLWDIDSGIYVYGKYAQESYPHYGANFHQDWEKNAHFEFFKKTHDTTEYRDNAIRMKIAGGWTRADPQKSLIIDAVSQNGKAFFSYPFFADKSAITAFEKLFLRASSIYERHLKNELIYKLNAQAKSSVSMQSYLPVTVFLNGEYWGVYNLMEMKDEKFIKSNYGYDDITMIEAGYIPILGSIDEYNKMINFFYEDLSSSPSPFVEIDSRIDIRNCIDYWFYEIYTGKVDNGNIRMWKPNLPGAKWRWLSYDMDIWYNLNNIERLTTSSQADRIAFLWPLLNVSEFKIQFINRVCDLLNTCFIPSSVEETIDTVVNDIRAEIPRHLNRWGGTLDGWNDQASWLKHFADIRPDSLIQQISSRFSLDGTAALSIALGKTAHGSVKINSLIIGRRGTWSGRYFRGIPLSLTALPDEGYRFEGWSLADSCESPSLKLTLSGDTVIAPVFRLAPGLVQANNQLVSGQDISVIQRIISVPGSIELSGTITSPADLFIYNATGDLVERYPVAAFSGRISIVNKGKTLHGKSLAPGIYFFALRNLTMKRRICSTQTGRFVLF